MLNYWTKTGVSCVGIIIAPNQAELVLTEGNSNKGDTRMLWTILVILLVLWLLGFIGSVGGNLIHLLLVIALVVLIINLISGRRPVV